MIVTERINSIGVVRLHRPDSRNALTGEMLRELTTAMLNFDRDPDIRVIVLTGSDPAFCAGLDLRDLANIYNGAVADPETPPVAMRSLMPLTVTPIIGAINGAAVTGGLELALGCDFLIASERATFADTPRPRRHHAGGRHDNSITTVSRSESSTTDVVDGKLYFGDHR